MYEDHDTERQGKANWALGLSVLSLGIFGLSVWLSCEFLTREAAAVCGIALLIPSILLHCKGKKRKQRYFHSFVLNALANGLIASVYYLSVQILPSLGLVAKSLLLPMLFLLCAYLFLGILQKGRAWVTLLLLLCNIGAMVMAVIQWGRGDVVYSACFFALIFSFIYIIVYSVSLYRAGRSVLRDLSMGIFGLVGMVVLVILSEGEALEGLFEGIIEFLGELRPGRRRKTKR